MDRVRKLFLLGIVVIAGIFGSTLLMDYALGDTAAIWTMIVTSWTLTWYMIRGIVKNYYISTSGKQGWTPQRRKIMNSLIVAGSLNVLVFFWFMVAKKDFLDNLDFAWK